MTSISVENLLTLFAPGERVFLAGSSGEPRPLVEALSLAAPDLPSLEITHSFLPGINTVPLAARENGLREVTLFPRAHNTAPMSVRSLTLSYYGARQHLAAQSFDWVVVQVAPPNTEGQCSLGTSVEFIPAALEHAQGVIGIINQAMPAIPGVASLPLSLFSRAIEVDWPLVSYEAGEPDGVSTRIAKWLSELIEDGSVLQLGLGRVPACLLEQLSGASNLRLHSGLLTPGLRTLAEAGALDMHSTHTTCTTLGNADFYQWLAERRDISICDVAQSHHPATLASTDKFIAINSALEVDLLGQANLETAAGKAVSSIGGAPDFCRGARCSNGGKSIIALPATARGGEISRIMTEFAPQHPVSIGRQDIDFVVTEFGIAELADKSAREKAQVLIEIAAPKFREELTTQLEKISKNL